MDTDPSTILSVYAHPTAWKLRFPSYHLRVLLMDYEQTGKTNEEELTYIRMKQILKKNIMQSNRKWKTKTIWFMGSEGRCLTTFQLL